MKSPVTSTTAMEAINSGVVSLGFFGGFAGTCDWLLEQPYFGFLL